jgi:hypothetical protein
MVLEVDQSISALWDLPSNPQKAWCGCKEIKLMQADLEAQKVSPAAYQAMLRLENFVHKRSKLEPVVERNDLNT